MWGVLTKKDPGIRSKEYSGGKGLIELVMQSQWHRVVNHIKETTFAF